MTESTERDTGTPARSNFTDEQLDEILQLMAIAMALALGTENTSIPQDHKESIELHKTLWNLHGGQL